MVSGEGVCGALDASDPNDRPAPRPTFEEIVDHYYRSLYQFALSLTHSEAEACDLTQHTFYVWATKGGQLRDASKLRTWLFTTLHRAFLQARRRANRFPHYELSEVDAELPEIAPLTDLAVDAARVLQALHQMDESFRAPLTLFYLEDCPYKEIAAIMEVPLGTVKSRIARGVAHLQRLLMRATPRLQRVPA